MKRILLPALLITLSFCVKAQTKTDSLKPQPVHVKDVVITNPQDADINIDMPAKSSDVTVNGIDPNLIYSAVQHQPDFPGGYNKLKEYFHNSLPVNPVADISGRVILQFVVEKDGSISNIKALRGNNDDSKAWQLIY